MRVLVINPNSTVSMTDGILSTARAASTPDMVLDGCTNLNGPPAIQGEADGIAAAEGVVKLVRDAAAQEYDAAIIACFDDTGLEASRAAVPIPVIGIGQAAFLVATIHGRFSVVTTLPGSVPVIEGNISGHGMEKACAKVRASGLPVLSLEADPEGARVRLEKCARSAAYEDDADALVLGCAGMSPFAAAMTTASGLPAVDGIAAATGLARTIIKA